MESKKYILDSLSLFYMANLFYMGMAYPKLKSILYLQHFSHQFKVVSWSVLKSTISKVCYRPVGRYQILGGHTFDWTQILDGHVPVCPPVPTGLCYYLQDQKDINTDSRGIQ